MMIFIILNLILINSINFSLEQVPCKCTYSGSEGRIFNSTQLEDRGIYKFVGSIYMVCIL
jgi:hypothetical protein